MMRTQVVPMGTPTWRQRKMEELGAHVVRHGETLSDAAAECGTLSHAPRLTAKPCFPAAGDALARLDGPNCLRRFLPSVCCFSLRMPERLAATSGQTIVHPYDDPLVIAGHGTIGLEILAQLKERRHCFRPCIPHRDAHPAVARLLPVAALRQPHLCACIPLAAPRRLCLAGSMRSSAAWAAAGLCRASPHTSKACGPTCGACAAQPLPRPATARGRGVARTDRVGSVTAWWSGR